MDQIEYSRLEPNYYLYKCNQKYDLENNIGEIEIPEFTMENIKIIDEEYKIHMSQVNEIIYQNSNLDENDVNKMNDLFELNELFIEHINNNKKLTYIMNKYNSNKTQLTVDGKINDYTIIRTNKIRMYFQEILPIIKNDEDNLNLVLILLSNK